jgi:hypothetical protein
VFDRQAKSPNHVSRNCEFDKDWLPGFEVAGSAGAALADACKYNGCR